MLNGGRVRRAVAVGTAIIGLSATTTVTAAAANPSAKGSAPNSPLCQALRPLSPTLSKDASDSSRASKARDWGEERSDYLAGLQVQAQEYAALLANPHGVPKSVTSAVPKALKSAKALATDLQHSKNKAQFTSPVSAIVVITYNKAQSKVLEYFAQQCGGGAGSSGATKGNAATGH
jgi:hypothetical protein